MGLSKQLEYPYDMAAGFPRVSNPKQSKTEAFTSFLLNHGRHRLSFLQYLLVTLVSPIHCGRGPNRNVNRKTGVTGGLLEGLLP